MEARENESNYINNNNNNNNNNTVACTALYYLLLKLHASVSKYVDQTHTRTNARARTHVRTQPR
jgi:hypothetical protein